MVVVTKAPHLQFVGPITSINTSDSYDKTQGQVQRGVTFTYFSRQIANKGKRLSSRFDDKSWFIQFVSL